MKKKDTLIIIALLLFVSCNGQQGQVGDFKVTIGKSQPCPIDTIRGILYRSGYSGNSYADTGYYIAPCSGIEIANLPYFDGNKTIKYPTWIPGRYLRNDNADKNGNQIYGQEWTWQFNTGRFTDKHFKKVNITSVYGLLVLNYNLNKLIL